MTSADLSAAAAALAGGRWAQARAAFLYVLDGADDPAAHDGLAQVAWWLDDADTSLAAREAAYRGYRAAGDDRAAARAAADLGYDSILFGRGAPVGRGWLARSADLLASQDDRVPEVGWLAVRNAEVALNVDRDAPTGLELARAAQGVGRVVGDDDLTYVGQALAGLALVRLGDVATGMGQLDGAAAAATAGDIRDLMWMGKVCCWLISACHDVQDLTRAATWCARVDEICTRLDLSPLLSVCRLQYASVLMAQGDGHGAESALAEALHALEHSTRASRLEAVAQLGELRRRQGRRREAEALLRQAGAQTVALISRCRLQLDEGDVVRAWATAAELLHTPWHQDQLARVQVLAVVVRAGVAGGLVDDARTASTELGDLAERLGTDAVRAAADAARARLAPGADAAIPAWQSALRHATAAGLGFEEAEHRLDYADCLRQVGDRQGAAEQADLALELLRRLGTGPGIERAHHLRDARSDDGPLTPRQTDVLRLLAAGSSNADIAAVLHLSEHTVHRHVANIYTALGLSSRAAAAAYAATRGLV